MEVKYDGVLLNKEIHPVDNPKVIDLNGAVLWGFDPNGCKGPDHFDFLEQYERGLGRTYKTIRIHDCHNVKIMNGEIWGGASCGVELMSSDASIGLKNITLENIKVKWGAARGIFSGGSNIDGVTLKDCSVLYTVWGNGDTTHGVYFSGGGWNPSFPPIRNIRVEGCDIGYTGGRHCLQFNGRFENIRVTENKLYHGQMGGLSLIGCQKVEVADNFMWGSSRWPIQVYDYTWGIDPLDEEQVLAFLKSHHPNRDIAIHHNTLVVGPKAWRHDAWHGASSYSPDRRPGIYVSNDCDGYFPYKQERIYIQDNVIVSPWAPMIGYQRVSCGEGTEVKDNMYWCSDEAAKPLVQIHGFGDKGIPYLEAVAPQRFSGNIQMDPKFRLKPSYTYHNEAEQVFDWSKHKSKCDLTSAVARKRGKGARINF